MEIKITRTQNPKAKPIDESNLGFARTFTDHMFIVEYDKGIGWHDARIDPYGPVCVDPASPIFHYTQEVLEATKVYSLSDGNVVSF